MLLCTNELSLFTKGFSLVVEHSTSVCYAVGAEVVSSIHHVAENHIYSQR